jgi:hypothetical protein
MDEIRSLKVENVAERGNGRESAAKVALVAYLRLLAACIEEEAEMIDAHPERAGEVLRRFRSEALDLSLRDAPVEALLQRSLPFARNGDK